MAAANTDASTGQYRTPNDPRTGDSALFGAHLSLAAAAAWQAAR